MAGGLAVSNVAAADLGGDCCADLEERIAELEATTVRKGNRKVSLKITGWVSAQLMYWDDGHEKNVYVNDNHNTLASNFQLLGSAKINSDWSAGFKFHIELVRGDNTSLLATQSNDDPAVNGDQQTSVLHAYWWIKSATLGQISIGQQSQASDNAAIIPGDVSGSNLIPANWVLFDGPVFQLRPTGGPNSTAGLANAIWGQFAFCQHTSLPIGADCNGVPTNSVVYVSPTIGGFTASASWGEDDFWDVALAYAGTLGDFKVAGKAAYSENTDDKPTAGNFTRSSSYFQIGAGIKHVPTGLFVYGAYGTEDNSGVTPAGLVTGRTSLTDGDHWYVKAGIQKKWFALGPTTIWGEYSEYKDMDAFANQDVCAALSTPGTNITAACGLGAVEATGSKFTRIGFGIQQDIEAASMILWAKYRHHELDVNFAGVGGSVSQGFENIDMILAGGAIFF